MFSKLRPFPRNSSQQIQIFLKPKILIRNRNHPFINSPWRESVSFRTFFRNFNHGTAPQNSDNTTSDHQSIEISSTDQNAFRIQSLLKGPADKAVDEIKISLQEGSLCLSDELVLNVLKRHRSDWKPAYAFFQWVSGEGKISDGFLPGTAVYNGILDILGKMHRFDELSQVLDEMSQRNVFLSERGYGIVCQRYAAAHKIEEATNFFYKRKEYKLELDLIAFHMLLSSLCRYRHVEAAEFLFHQKKNEFTYNTRTWNIILNGWCVLGRLREAKRFWNDIMTSNCKPDKFTYAIFINSLSKAGKICTAVKLFQAMWEKGFLPHVAICNSIIEGLCSNKRIPEALEIFSEMNDRECSRDVATYNSLIKHLCKIRKMDKVNELLNEMEMEGGSCLPNNITYGYLINSSTNPKEVYGILEMMKKNGVKMMADTYNMVLRLFIGWCNEYEVKFIWQEMEKNGQGPDQRSYTIMVHGLFDKGMLKEALKYYDDMILKGMIPEPRTKLLVNAMHIRESNDNYSSNVSHKKGKMGIKKTFRKDLMSPSLSKGRV